jgi:hypothetical protein
MGTIATCVLLLLSIGLLPVGAQEESNPTFSADSRLVVLHATVVDSKGRLVTNLSQAAFTVLENNTVQDKGEAKKARKALEALAKASGGTASFPRELSEVSPAAVAIASEIRNQYVIAYSPTSASVDGTFQTVRVEVKGPNKPKVRTRSGYYANAGQRSKR